MQLKEVEAWVAHDYVNIVTWEWLNKQVSH
jgi:hypothetical protein